jgi:hypothetical protein
MSAEASGRQVAVAGAAAPSSVGAGSACRCGTEDECCNGCDPQNESGACSNDGLDCTGDFCRAGACIHEIAAEACLLEGRCYANATSNPKNKCQFCDASRDHQRWSERAQNAPCDDGLFCNGAEKCGGGTDSGRCLAAENPCRVIEDPCRTCDEATDSCMAKSPSGWRDPATGLLWRREVRERTWPDAKDDCAEQDRCGAGWRLPTIGELRTLIRGCPATELGGACTLTDSCLSGSCVNTACQGCENDGGTSPLFLAPELRNYNLRSAWSSSSNPDWTGMRWTMNFVLASVEEALESDSFPRHSTCVSAAQR